MPLSDEAMVEWDAMFPKKEKAMTTTPRTIAVMEEMLEEVEPVRYSATKCVEIITRKLGDLAVDLERELAAARHSLSEGISACEWTSDYPDEEPAVIATSLTSGCGHEWMGDGEVDPPGRWMKFCPFCGGKTPFSEVPK